MNRSVNIDMRSSAEIILVFEGFCDWQVFSKLALRSINACFYDSRVQPTLSFMAFNSSSSELIRKLLAGPFFDVKFSQLLSLIRLPVIDDVFLRRETLRLRKYFRPVFTNIRSIGDLVIAS